MNADFLVREAVLGADLNRHNISVLTLADGGVPKTLLGAVDYFLIFKALEIAGFIHTDVMSAAVVVPCLLALVRIEHGHSLAVVHIGAENIKCTVLRICRSEIMVVSECRVNLVCFKVDNADMLNVCAVRSAEPALNHYRSAVKDNRGLLNSGTYCAELFDYRLSACSLS